MKYRIRHLMLQIVTIPKYFVPCEVKLIQEYCFSINPEPRNLVGKLLTPKKFKCLEMFHDFMEIAWNISGWLEIFILPGMILGQNKA